MSDRNRAIDALVAEHAMGWKWYRFGKSRFLRPDGSWATLNRRLADMTEDTPDDTGYPQGQFSTDPAASKQLRDNMRELGWMPFMKYFQNLEDESGRIVVMAGFRRFGTTEEYTAKDKSEEPAWSLAALSALGIEAPK